MNRKEIIKELMDWLVHIALAVAITIIIINYVGQFTVVQGNSMLPTLKPDSVLIIEKLTQRFSKLEQGDIVVLKIPELLGDNKTYAVKRVIATEGQNVSIRNGIVYVDGKALEEDYRNGTVTSEISGMYSDMTVPKNCIYVLGDNRYPGASKDSRYFGPINTNRVTGRVVFRVYPIPEMGQVK